MPIMAVMYTLHALLAFIGTILHSLGDYRPYERDSASTAIEIRPLPVGVR